jgi:arylsulfatase A-like enzyme
VPTVVDYVGLSIPKHLPGASLLPYIDGKSKGPIREFIIGSMSQVRVTKDRPPIGKSPWVNLEDAYYLTDKEWHYIWYKDRDLEELYDKKKDPGENNNVVKDHPDLAKKFRLQIEAWDGFRR